MLQALSFKYQALHIAKCCQENVEQLGRHNWCDVISSVALSHLEFAYYKVLRQEGTTSWPDAPPAIQYLESLLPHIRSRAASPIYPTFMSLGAANCSVEIVNIVDTDPRVAPDAA